MAGGIDLCSWWSYRHHSPTGEPLALEVSGVTDADGVLELDLPREGLVALDVVEPDAVSWSFQVDALADGPVW